MLHVVLGECLWFHWLNTIYVCRPSELVLFGWSSIYTKIGQWRSWNPWEVSTSHALDVNEKQTIISATVLCIQINALSTNFCKKFMEFCMRTKSRHDDVHVCGKMGRDFNGNKCKNECKSLLKQIFEYQLLWFL